MFALVFGSCRNANSSCWTNRTRFAWDAFALPHLLDQESPMLVSTRCPACSRPYVWNVDRDEPPAGEQVAHFLVPVTQMWDDIVHTCGHQRIFCSSVRLTASTLGWKRAVHLAVMSGENPPKQPHTSAVSDCMDLSGVSRESTSNGAARREQRGRSTKKMVCRAGDGNRTRAVSLGS